MLMLSVVDYVSFQPHLNHQADVICKAEFLWLFKLVPPQYPVPSLLSCFSATPKGGVGNWDHTLCRASVLPKQSTRLLGTFLDGSPLQRRALKWLNNHSKQVLIVPTSEGRQAESTLPGINSTAEWDLNSGSKDPKPTTRTIKPTPGI